MNQIKSLAEFLKEQKLSPSCFEAESLIQSFLEEMKNGLSKRGSSLQMLPSYVAVKRDFRKNQEVAVVDAGGTHFRVGLIFFDEKRRPHLRDFQKFPMPGTQGILSKAEFFEHIAQKILPYLKTTRELGFCFSYPTEMFPNGEGKLLFWTKEIQAPEVVGQNIIENLLKAFAKAGNPAALKISLVNDASATLLALLSEDLREEDEPVALILGTGTNSAYIESAYNIPKLAPGISSQQVINLESAGFNQLPRGRADLRLDASTRDKGRNVFEKMSSGAYLGLLAFEVFTEAATQGLLSENTVAILKKKISPSFHLEATLAGEEADSIKRTGGGDFQTLSAIVESLTERAALLAAINLTAVSIQSLRKKPRKEREVFIAANGSTYEKLPYLKEKMHAHLDRLLFANHGIAYRIKTIKDAPAIGAAIAVLSELA